MKHFQLWLHGCPCMFARTFAQLEQRLVFYVVLDGLSQELEAIEHTFDKAADDGDFAAILFPRLRYAEEIVDVILELSERPRWSHERVRWRKFPRYKDTAVGLLWQTMDGEASSAMGFAPLGSMPVSRRAPYIAIIAWPGKRRARKGAKQDERVGFIDGRHDMKPHAYKTALRNSKDLTVALFGDPPEDREHLRKIAFCLPKSAAARLFG